VRFQVILCRFQGRRLKRSEWPAPVVGELSIADIPAKENNFRRNVRMAQLRAHLDAFGTALVDVTPPLFDPQLLPAAAGRLVIRGIELDIKKAEGGGYTAFEHEQVWLCTLAL
jgi:hypothetical protein